ncbi:hypothetical protein PRUPE_7G042300 [Prunus persica]|uniref:Uncharacterized protein n=1 Tax=Prunus persica TaxID=3760 RepID=A0A251N6J7_PRUPE|nr:hypothetical protein PRUPE_7G042300 [Prunus persica]
MIYYLFFWSLNRYFRFCDWNPVFISILYKLFYTCMWLLCDFPQHSCERIKQSNPSIWWSFFGIARSYSCVEGCKGRI